MIIYDRNAAKLPQQDLHGAPGGTIPVHNDNVEPVKNVRDSNRRINRIPDDTPMGTGIGS